MSKQIMCPTKLIHPEAKAPERSTEGAVGHDICCVAGLVGVDRNKWDAAQLGAWEDMERLGAVTVTPGESFLFRTGFAQAIEEGHACYFWDRSSMGGKKVVGRLAGVIDDDYRGEWFVRLVNHSHQPVRITVGDKIVQGVYHEKIEAECPIVDELLDTARGTGGFGSTDEPQPSEAVHEEDAQPPVLPPDTTGGSAAAPDEEDVSAAVENVTGGTAAAPVSEIVYNGANVANAMACLRDGQRDSAAAWISRDADFFPNGAPPIDLASLHTSIDGTGVAFKPQG